MKFERGVMFIVEANKVGKLDTSTACFSLVTQVYLKPFACMNQCHSTYNVNEVQISFNKHSTHHKRISLLYST